ncbi:MAG: class I SAM-dependent methyltransferase [Candidatus Micrarchaeota archaeon]
MQQWDKVFKKEGKVFTAVQEDIPRISRLFKKRKVKRILDLGCGSGRHIIYFAKRGFDIYGIDISEGGLEIAKSWSEKEKVKADLKIGSIYKKLPYPRDFFDAVISIQVIHHGRINNVRKAIREIERVLKPSGLVFITVPKQHKEISKIIAARTYVPIIGWEKGLAHYLFNKNLLRKEFKNFRIYDIWTSSIKQYCLLGELKQKRRRQSILT